MGKRGPTPKPTVLKILNGNPGKRPLNTNEPKPKPVAPVCPKWMNSLAKKEWRRITKELEALDLLTCIDGAALSGYCTSYAAVQEAEIEINQHGKTTYITDTGFIRDIPAIARQQKYLAIMRQYLGEFGLSPSSRSRLNIEKGDDNAEDPMEELLSRRR